MYRKGGAASEKVKGGDSEEEMEKERRGEGEGRKGRKKVEGQACISAHSYS